MEEHMKKYDFQITERYKIDPNFIDGEDTPYSYSVGYMCRYGGGSEQLSWRVVETFFNKDVAERVCDELNARRILEQKISYNIL